MFVVDNAENGQVSSVKAATVYELGLMPDDLRRSAAAAAVIALASAIDNPRAATMAVAPMVKELRESIAALWAQAPPQVENDTVDEVSRLREQRQAQAAAAGE